MVSCWNVRATEPADRRKIRAVKELNPNLDLRMVFQAPFNKISKKSKTTYAKWCEKHDIPWTSFKTSPSIGSSEFLFHEPCEECGSSDAKSVYDDGHTYCFVCHHYTHGDGRTFFSPFTKTNVCK